jgi:plasmid stabilization system protein ParE
LAETDYEDAVDYYLTQASPAIARKLDLAVNHALHLILEHPRIGAGTQKGARKLALQGFPYDLVYRIETDTVIVLAVSSHSRQPGYWAGRL